MDLYEAIENRRSVRSYMSDEIPEEVLNRVMRATGSAPSGGNRQPWTFILVKDPGVKSALAPAAGGQRFLADAPVIVVACGAQIPISRGGYMGEYGMLVDVSIAMTHLILAAHAEGLGTCWIGDFENDEVKEVLGIPEEIQVVALTPLGYPESVPSSRGRKPLEEIVRLDRWG